MYLRVGAALAANVLLSAGVQATTVVTGIIPAGNGGATLTMPGFANGNRLHFDLTYDGGLLEAAVLTTYGEYRYLDWEVVGIDDDGAPIWFLNGNEADVFTECVSTSTAGCSTSVAEVQSTPRRLTGTITYPRGYNQCGLGPERVPGVCAEETNSLVNYLDLYMTNDTDVNYRLSFDFSAIPEPASWAMMIGGLGMVGGAMRRRRVSTKVSTKVSFA
jgi:hypothetical protein